MQFFSSQHKKLLAVALLCLVTGALNYYLFQPDIYLFKILPLPHKTTFYIAQPLLRHFMGGYFSDACWCVALYSITVLLSELNYLNSQGKIITLALPFATEVAQYFCLIPGVFDWLDLLTYGIVLTVFIKMFDSLKLFHHEKH